MAPKSSPTKEENIPKFDTEAWDKKVKQAESLRTQFERQWFNNMAFYRGNQWVAWVKNPATNLGVSLTQPKSARKRLVFNKIRPYIRNEFTKLTKEEQQFWVEPNTVEMSDMSAAKTAEAIAEYLLYVGKFNKARASATWWSSVTGTGFLKTWYDTSITLPPSINAQTGEITPQIKGAVAYNGVSPYHLYVPYLDMEDVADQPWVCHARTYDQSSVFEHWKKKIEPDTETSSLGSEQRFLSSINATASNRFKQVHVKEIWIKPCDRYPEGGLFVYAGNEVLYEGTFYKHGEYPFQKINGTRSGGFYCSSIIEDLIPMQKEYNLTRSQLAEARDLTAKPAMTVTKGTVDTKKIMAKPGLIIEVQPGGEHPKRLINPDYPAYVMQDLELTISDMDNGAGQYEITKGHTPPGVEAASAIAYLQEENDTRLHDSIVSIENAVSESGRQSLQLVQQFWDQTRIVKTVSTAHLQGTIEFKGKDLRSNTDLRVVSGSMAPRSAAAKQAFILEAVDRELITPDIALKYLPLNDTAAMYAEVQVDQNQARRENLRMSRGEQVVVNDWDNHVIHVQEHEIYMKGQEFELQEEGIKQIYIQHRTEHQQIALAGVLQDAAAGPGDGTEFGGTDVPIEPGTEQQSPEPVL